MLFHSNIPTAQNRCPLLDIAVLHQHIHLHFGVSIEIVEHLGSFLRSRRSAHILSNISRIMECSRAALDTLPNLLNRRRSRLCTNKGIDSRLQLSELALNEAALSEAGTEEGGVDGD